MTTVQNGITGGEFAGKVIWVVGAGGDIGRGISAELSAQGAIVIGSSRQAEPDRDPEASSQPWHRWISANIRKETDLEVGLTEITAEFGGIDGLVVSTTLPIFGDYLDLAAKDWFEVLDTKLLGSVRAIQVVAPHLIERGGGGIVLITGTARGNIPALKHWPGSTANVALNFLVGGLAARFSPSGIRINAIAPGPIASARLDVMAGLSSTPATTPLPRRGVPEDIGAAVSFLLSDRAAFVTGAVLPVDGGGKF